jgi:hypothetical protein
MKLLVLPRTPTQTDILRMTLERFREIPEAWQMYLPPPVTFGTTLRLVGVA